MKQENLESFATRLTEALRYRNVTKSELARKLNMDRSTITKYTNGENEPRADKIYKVSQILKVSPVWLIGFDVPMIETKKTEVEFQIYNPTEFLRIPLLGEIPASFNQEAFEYHDGEYFDIPVDMVTSWRRKQDLFALKVVGDSMYPILLKNDIVLVDTGLEVRNGEIGVFFYDESSTIKKYGKSKEEIELIAINPEYQNKVFKINELESINFRTIGKVTQLLKRKF